MKAAQVIVSAVVIGALIAGAWWLARTPEEVVVIRGPLVASLKSEAASLARIEVARGDKTVALVKQGDQWTVETSGGYPAELARVRELVSNVAALERDQALTTKKERFAEMSLEWPDASGKAGLVRFASATGTPIEVVLGEQKFQPETQFARLLSESQAWRCRGAVNVEVEPNHWMNTNVLALPPDEITGVTYQGLELRPGTAEAGKQPQWEAVLGVGPVDESAWPDEKKTEAKQALPSWITRLDFEDVRPRGAEWIVDPKFVITFDTPRALVHAEGMTQGDATWVRLCADPKDGAPPIPDDKKQQSDAPSGTPYIPDWKAWSEQVAQWEYKLPDWKRASITRIHEPKPPKPPVAPPGTGAAPTLPPGG